MCSAARGAGPVSGGWSVRGARLAEIRDDGARQLRLHEPAEHSALDEVRVRADVVRAEHGTRRHTGALEPFGGLARGEIRRPRPEEVAQPVASGPPAGAGREGGVGEEVGTADLGRDRGEGGIPLGVDHDPVVVAPGGEDTAECIAGPVVPSARGPLPDVAAAAARWSAIAPKIASTCAELTRPPSPVRSRRRSSATTAAAFRRATTWSGKIVIASLKPSPSPGYAHSVDSPALARTSGPYPRRRLHEPWFPKALDSDSTIPGFSRRSASMSKPWMPGSRA